MKTIIILFLLGMPLYNLCQEIFPSDYRALTVPHKYRGKIDYLQSDTTICIAGVDTLKHNASLLSSFPNLVSNVTVYQVDASGELTIAGLGVSAKSSTYEVIYDFAQSQTYDSKQLTEKLVGSGDVVEPGIESALIGVSVRMVAKVKTRKAGINLSSPFSLIANMEKIEGSLEVRVIGIGSQKINSIIPTTTDLSPASISICLQAVATIKSHIYDKETIITPQYLAYSYKKLPEVNNKKKKSSPAKVEKQPSTAAAPVKEVSN